MGLRTTSAEMPAKARALGRARPGLRSAEARPQAWGYLFLAPMFLLLVVFKFVPMLQAFYLSLTSYDLLSPPRFVGLRNYVTLLEDPLFHQSVGVTAYYVFGTCILIWFVSLGMALIFNAPLPAKICFRRIYLTPPSGPTAVSPSFWF